MSSSQNLAEDYKVERMWLEHAVAENVPAPPYIRPYGRNIQSDANGGSALREVSQFHSRDWVGGTAGTAA